MPVKHEGLQANIHPNDEGKWIWHLTVARHSDLRRTEGQVQGLKTFIEREEIGEGEVTVYEGGSVMKLIHATRLLREDEVAKLPEGVESMTAAFEKAMVCAICKGPFDAEQRCLCVDRPN